MFTYVINEMKLIFPEATYYTCGRAAALFRLPNKRYIMVYMAKRDRVVVHASLMDCHGDRFRWFIRLGDDEIKSNVTEAIYRIRIVDFSLNCIDEEEMAEE